MFLAPEKTALKAAPTLGQVTKMLRAIGSPKGGLDVRKLLDRLRLDREAVQRIIGRSDEIIPALCEHRPLIEVFETLSFPTDFADEEVTSSCGYLSGYNGTPTLVENLADLERELTVIRAVFPEFADSDLDRAYLERIKSGEIELPYGAERWTLRPDWYKIAPVYTVAIEKIFGLLREVYGSRFENLCEGEPGTRWLYETRKKVRAMGAFNRTQNADVLIIPIQFGMRHHGRSVRRARSVMGAMEFGLGAYEIGIMLLSHANRLCCHDDLRIDCAGDSCSPGADGVSRSALFVSFRVGRLEVDASWISSAKEDYGSASGFLPQ